MTQVRNAMDICMLTPSEYRKIHELLGKYNDVRTELVRYLEEIFTEWSDELQTHDYENVDDELCDQMTYRFERIGDWIQLLVGQDLEISEVDEVIIFDDEE
jgi:hypothetical protein